MAIGTGSALLLGGAMLGGAGLQYFGAKNAGEAQADASEKAAWLQHDAALKGIASQEKMYEQSREDLAPWRAAGEVGLKNVIQMAEAGPGNFIPEADPGYEFGYKNFIERPTLALASATGKLRSGATQKALTRYASDYASTKYDNFLSRHNNKMAPFQSLAQIGQTATGQQVSSNQNTAGNISNITMQGALAQGNAIQNAGSARASGYINQSNALSGGLNNMANLYALNQMMA